MEKLKIAMVQMNSVVGDIHGNRNKILDSIKEAEKREADICIFPELCLTGYPPQDLIFDDDFISRNMETADYIMSRCHRDMIVIFGYIYRLRGRYLYNSLAVIRNRTQIARIDKTLLPTYDVFDEARYFSHSRNPHPVDVSIRGHELSLGIQICEDLWDVYYDTKPTDILSNLGADIILNASASPFNIGKIVFRHGLVEKKIKKNNIPFLYTNMVGGQDELVFDGNSFAMDKNGNFAMVMPDCKETMAVCEFNIDGTAVSPVPCPEYDLVEQEYNVLVLGIRDYFYKSGFSDAVIGLSGGIDSALVAALAVEALGSDHVHTYAMPSQFSSNHSLSDAEKLADNLGCRFNVIPIERIYHQFMVDLAEPFRNTSFGLAEENLQARIRGNILMSISNKFSALVLSTGNKTELALGYCTMYGDMCGALAPISDLNKSDVYKLSEFINSRAGYNLIPEHTMNKLPSAELAEGQTDPFDYDIVSPLVEDILENDLSMQEIEEKYKDRHLVRKLDKMIQITEFKRYQSAPGLKVTSRSFGRGRRMPLVNRFDRYTD